MSDTYSPIIKQGKTFRVPMSRWNTDEDGVKTTLQNLSGYTAKLQVRKHAASSDVVLELTHASGITLAATDPNIIVTITDEQTATIPAGRYSWELELYSGGEVYQAFTGEPTVRAEVVR